MNLNIHNSDISDSLVCYNVSFGDEITNTTSTDTCVNDTSASHHVPLNCRSSLEQRQSSCWLNFSITIWTTSECSALEKETQDKSELENCKCKSNVLLL